MSGSERQKLNEEELFFYEDRVCGEADLLYRFCFALTLNQEVAQKLLLMTYKDAAGTLNTLIGKTTNQLRQALLKIALGLFKDGDKKTAVGSSPLVGFLSSLPAETRATIFAVDIAGLTVSEGAAVVGGGDENAFRKKLAMARKALVLDKNFA